MLVFTFSLNGRLNHIVNLFGEEDFLSNLSFSVRTCLFVDLAAVRFSACFSACFPLVFRLFFHLSKLKVIRSAFFPLRFSLDGNDLS